MNCQNCGTKLPDAAKFCTECGERITTSGPATGNQDSVVTRSPGAGGNFAPVINLSSKEKEIHFCPNCTLEISNENKPLKCLECGSMFCEHCEGFYRDNRKRGEKPLCLKCYTTTLVRLDKEKSESFNLDEDEFDYIDFFNDLRKMVMPALPNSSIEPDGNIWYRIPAGIEGVHFEWYFELFKIRKLGVEIHFETNQRSRNQEMLSEIAKLENIIEEETKEKVYIQRSWGRTRDWSRLFLVNQQLDNIDELKKWAAEKMQIFYAILQPKLQEIASTALTSVAPVVVERAIAVPTNLHTGSDVTLTPSQREYIEFFSDISRRFSLIVPIHLHTPDGRYYHQIPFGISGVHFEWMFGGRPRNRFGVELHFEGHDRHRNKKMLEQAAKYRNEIDRLTGEKVVTQYEWKNKSRLYVTKTQGIIDEELKRWAVDKMVIFYQTLSGMDFRKGSEL